MKILFHGHSCIQLFSSSHSILIDPYIDANPVAVVKANDIVTDYILLTHGHDDHITDAVPIAKQNDAPIIAVEELAEYMASQGVKKTEAMHVGGDWTFDFGRVYLTPALHTSSVRTLDGQRLYAGVPVGYVIEMGGKIIYHAGDSGLFSDMKWIGQRFDIDIAFLPIGGRFTMGPSDALLAAEWIQPRHVVPIHYGTFPLIQQDGVHFIENLSRKGISGTAMQPGEMIEIN
ncbi:metal-dependent hydrolase [Paenibacillus sp. 19GGS1-52]|uniref:metal-dependent hydrolase n=1 Tax=Paenibacillus sp. 19GGS1-52 TaxID=2758563 RepID=UPI001EFA8A3E|nr:metal-dependent hydrolase [Paenibacillus sp. 19GGS1-52]ULO08169.1 metal-dependent hydrolase [Paenibacillus sp. 19GGS1-52]